MGYGVIGSPTGSGPVSLGSSPGTPAGLPLTGPGMSDMPGFPSLRREFPVFWTSKARWGAAGPQRAWLWADLVSVWRGTCSVAGPDPAAAAAALSAREAQDEQQDDRADDRADDARRVELVRDPVELDELPQEAAHERTDHAEQDGAEDPDRVPAGHEQPRHGARDESDDDQDNNECHHDAGCTTFGVIHAVPRPPGIWGRGRVACQPGRAAAVWRRSGRYASLGPPPRHHAGAAAVSWPRRLAAQDAALSRR